MLILKGSGYKVMMGDKSAKLKIKIHALPYFRLQKANNRTKLS